VIGTEKNIRRCVNDLFTKTHVWNEEMVTQKYPINAFDINFITSILEFIERKLANSIAYPYNMNIFSHLYILILRMREGDKNNAFIYCSKCPFSRMKEGRILFRNISFC